MKEINDKWLETVVEKVNRVESPVPEGAWESIRTGVATKKRRSRTVAWIATAAIAAAAAVTPVAILSLYNSSTENIITDAGSTVTASSEEPSSPTEIIPDKTPETVTVSPFRLAEAPAARPKTVAAPSTAEPASAVAELTEKPVKKGINLTDRKTDKDESPTKDKDKENETKDIPEAGPATVDLEKYLASLPDEDEPARRHRAIGYSLSGNMALATSTADIWNRDLLGGTSVAEDGFYGLGLAMNASPSPAGAIPRKAVSAFQYRHHQPISAKLAVSYPLSDRWSVESGVLYTFIYSDITSKNPETGTLGSQQIHFLGIPLALRYTFLDSGRSSLYAIAGGAAEKSIKASAHNDTFTLKPWFRSVNVGAGYQLNILRGLGLFVEAGGSWHFRNDAVSYTPYDNNPLQFSLQAGIRIY